MQRRRGRQRKRHSELNLHRFKLHRYNSTSFNLSNVANFSAVIILNDFIQDQKQEKENRCLVFTSFSFTSWSCKDAGKGMNKKAWCTCRTVVLLICRSRCRCRCRCLSSVIPSQKKNTVCCTL